MSHVPQIARRRSLHKNAFLSQRTRKLSCLSFLSCLSCLSAHECFLVSFVSCVSPHTRALLSRRTRMLFCHWHTTILLLHKNGLTSLHRCMCICVSCDTDSSKALATQQRPRHCILPQQFPSLCCELYMCVMTRACVWHVSLIQSVCYDSFTRGS